MLMPSSPDLKGRNEAFYLYKITEALQFVFRTYLDVSTQGLRNSRFDFQTRSDENSQT